MSLRARMSAIVGDENTVARYLLEKVGHTALIAWVLVCVSGLNAERALRLSLLTASIAAALGYLLVGKLLWLRSNLSPGLGKEARDVVFDLILGLAVAVIALIPERGWIPFACAFALWCLAIAVGSNNQWGRPS